MTASKVERSERQGDEGAADAKREEGSAPGLFIKELCENKFTILRWISRRECRCKIVRIAGHVSNFVPVLSTGKTSNM